MSRYISYYRVSTNKQGESGLGLQAQQSSVRQFVTSRSGDLIAEFTEVESGKLATRPILQEAIAQCRRHKAVLVIAKLDRLARNVAFVSSLMEAGIEFVAVDAPYANRLMLHILAAVAENEREQISQRTKAALAAAKARGIRLGSYGQALAVQHKKSAAEWAEHLRPQLVDSLRLGNCTLAAHADYLNQLGLRSREGGRFHPASLSRIMARLELPVGQGGMKVLPAA